MSGGVDSSVIAALLHEQGHEVIGVHMRLHDAEGAGRPERSCSACSGTGLWECRACKGSGVQDDVVEL